MRKIAIGVLSVLFTVVAAHGQTTPHHTAANRAAVSSDVENMPSEAEIGELVSKAKEYVETYKRIFKDAKPSLDKAPSPGFYDEGMTLSEQAASVIAAIQKSGSSAYRLVSLVTILDDMSLNAAKASSSTMILALGQDKDDPNNHAMQDFLDIAQAGKNCYDISELLIHATLRYIAVEETLVQTVLNHQKR